MKRATVSLVALMLCSFQAEVHSGGAPGAAHSTLMSRQAPICPVKGQVQKNCTCNITCTSRFFFLPCVRSCHNESRCQCPEGTVIDEDRNECVSPDECPEIPCPAEGQSFSSNCRQINATCSNPSTPAICDSPMCACPLGQVVDEETNKCINISECTCPIKGQIRRECASHPNCHQACNTIEPGICPAICIVNGCECPNGTVIDETKNECVAPRECTACPIKGQVRRKCASHPDCHQTCNTTEPVACPEICIFNGCECPDGTVIDEDKNECVAPSECEEGVCPVKGQIQKNCTTCPATCIGRFFRGGCIPSCYNESRCQCPEGTVLDEDRNECVPPDECPEIPCPAEGQSFGPNCRQLNATCSNPSTPAVCDLPMCACPLGQVVDEEINKCVNISECTCPIKGQVRKECASHPDCHQTCNTTEPVACPEICIINGCECPNGTVIDEDKNECVAPSECEEACPVQGQVRKACAAHPSCIRTCTSRFVFRPCLPVCVDNGCECPTGTVIDTDSNRCVRPSECPTITCPVEGQFYTANCYGENATCSDPNPGLLCNRPQCVCPRGQVIDADGKTCINGTECSNPCNIKRILGKAKYRNNRRRLILRFLTNRQGRQARFLCQIDDGLIRPCTSPMKWINLHLEPGEHSVTVLGSCIYNSGVTSTSSRSFSFQV